MTREDRHESHDIRGLESGDNNLVKCRGICERYRATRIHGESRYANGQRRCQTCEIFIKWEGLWCPCCGYRLRTLPKSKKYKEIFRKTTTMTTT